MTLGEAEGLPNALCNRVGVLGEPLVEVESAEREDVVQEDDRVDWQLGVLAPRDELPVQIDGV